MDPSRRAPRSRSALVALLVLELAGCTSPSTQPASTSPARPSPARHDPSASSSGEPVEGAPPDDPASPPATPARPPTQPEPTIVDLWHDTTTGPLLTLVYVTEQAGHDGARAPAALVFSSDPTNAHFKRGSSSHVTVLRMVRSDMQALATDLGAAGLRRLPWSAEPVDAQIGPARALYLYESGQRQRVEKSALDDGGRRAFTAVERRLIQETTKEHDGPVRVSGGPGATPRPR